MKLKVKQIAVPALAAGALVGMGVWEFARPASAAMATPSPAAPQENNALQALDDAMENLAARVTPAVVNVNVTSKLTQRQLAADEGGQDQQQEQQQMQQFFGGPNSPFGQFFQLPRQPQGPQVEKGQGSGVIISPDGYIVTNNHVVQGAMDINVTLSNRDVYKAKLIGTDPLTDLAVIKINATNLPSVPCGPARWFWPSAILTGSASR
jgi:serine protease Do